MGSANNEDGEGGEDDDATALPEDENHESGRMASKVSDDESRRHEPQGRRAVQLLAIRANFHVCEIYGFDNQQSRCIYVQPEVEEEVREGIMVDLVPIGPSEILTAYGYLILKVHADESGPSIFEEAWDWDVTEDDEIEEYTQTTICADSGRKFEITYLVIPSAIEAKVEVKLKLKDLAGSISRAVYGKIKASSTDYGNKSVHLFSCERGTSESFPSGSTFLLPLSPSMVAVPCRWQLQLHVEVDLTIITTSDDSQEEQDKNLKFSLGFTREIMRQEREIDDDHVEVNIKWCRIW